MTKRLSYHGDEPSHEAEVLEMVGVDGRGGVDLQAVVILVGVFKQAVHGIEDLMGEHEKPLPEGKITFRLK